MLSSICLLVSHLPTVVLRLHKLNDKCYGKHLTAPYIASFCNNNKVESKVIPVLN
jgi:hypothetical protein